ncbi:MAG: sigma-70 family RNA polymerase sigma factor [Dehalococcoidia bacterium]|nr:sigma-70 family RNA polymerase sigma factor [Dehalococcoidia bacterium]
MIAWTEAFESRLPTADEQRQFVDAARSGDREAWGQLFRDNFQSLYRYAVVRVGDHHAAEEIAAQVFEEAYRGIGGFRYRGVSVRSWLFAIARNLTADHLRRRSRTPTTGISSEPAAMDQLAEVGVRTDVIRALRQLTEDQQHVIVLRFMHDMSLGETGHVLGKSSMAVSALQARALTQLRRLLADSGHEPSNRNGGSTDGV